LGGRVRAHRKFKTAVVLLPPEVLGQVPPEVRKASEPFHVDVATTRTEFYDYPAALPRVEHASIRQDLFRRDFTVNAMAISLGGADFGTVVDFFGGYRDLRSRVLRVLHNLSFIEDPTRIFRAVRYENRYGFRMDEHTRDLAKSCVEMHLVGDLSSVRLRDELIALLSEGDIDWSLHRLSELGVAHEVHPKLATDDDTLLLVKRLDELVQQLALESEVVTWRLRLAAMTRNMSHDELYLWLEQLKLKRTDSTVVRDGVVVGPRLSSSLSRGA
jgi:tRNA nucleotidyltransferase (CCA-adding enzyme)